MSSNWWQAARQQLATDSLLGPFIELIPETPPAREDPFDSLVWAIISQQLSDKVVRTIRQRLVDRAESNPMTAASLINLAHDDIRACGLSNAKSRSILELAQKVSAETFSLYHLDKLPDEEAINYLIQLRGVGRWTAEMFLLFSLHRPDIFAIDDLGLRTAVARLANIDRNDTQTILTIAQQWAPYRSLASRMLWKSLSN